MRKFLRKLWFDKINRVLIVLGGVAILFWALSYLWIFFEYGLMLCVAIICFLLAFKFFRKKKNDDYADFFPQSNNLKQNLREEREEHVQKTSRFFLAIVFLLLGILIIYKFIDFLISEEAQEALLFTQWMYPAKQTENPW